MAETITVQFTGMDRFQKAMGMLAQQYRSPRPVLKLIGGVMVRQARNTFVRQRDPVTGAPWKKSRRGGKTLSDTSRMLNSIVARQPVIAGNTVKIGTNAPYGPAHQLGMTIKPKNAKMLAIPLNREAERAKGAGRWWKKNESKKPFIWKGVQGKNVFIVYVEKRGKSKGKIVPMFLLLPRVKMPLRRFLGLGIAHKLEIQYEVIAAGERIIKAMAGLTGASRAFGGTA